MYEITDLEKEKPGVNTLTVKAILTYIQAGNWPKAILSGALTVAPQLKQYLTTDQWRVLNYAVNTMGAVTFWDGLSMFASRIGVPVLSLAGWHGRLNPGEDDELNAVRTAQSNPEISAPE